MKIILFLFILLQIITIKGFECGKSGVIIKDEWVNDGYCDCPEMTDEDETGACNIVDNDGTFFCRNHEIFHLQQRIPLSYIGDKKCDCLDGSDEEKGTCPDTISDKLTEQMKNLTAQRMKMQRFQLMQQNSITTT